MGIYYAEVIDGIVTRVVTVDSFDYIVDNPDRYGDSDNYIESDYSDPFAWGARVGWSYDEEYGFRPPAPYDNWIWDVANGWWMPPKPLPPDAKTEENPDGIWYEWNQDADRWEVKRQS